MKSAVYMLLALSVICFFAAFVASGPIMFPILLLAFTLNGSLIIVGAASICKAKRLDGSLVIIMGLELVMTAILLFGLHILKSIH